MYRKVTVIALAILLVVSIFLAVAIGSVNISLGKIWGIILR